MQRQYMNIFNVSKLILDTSSAMTFDVSYSQISIAKAGCGLSQEVIIDVVSTDVVTGVYVALTDYLKIKQLKLEDQVDL